LELPGAIFIYHAPPRGATTAEALASGPSGVWEVVGSEGEAVDSVEVGAHVRYGAEGVGWVERLTDTPRWTASNWAFGRDPAPGVKKVVQVLRGAGASAASSSGGGWVSARSEESGGAAPAARGAPSKQPSSPLGALFGGALEAVADLGGHVISGIKTRLSPPPPPPSAANPVVTEVGPAALHSLPITAAAFHDHLPHHCAYRLFPRRAWPPQPHFLTL
jgi:hypothetical protein